MSDPIRHRGRIRNLDRVQGQDDLNEQIAEELDAQNPDTFQAYPRYPRLEAVSDGETKPSRGRVKKGLKSSDNSVLLGGVSKSGKRSGGEVFGVRITGFRIGFLLTVLAVAFIIYWFLTASMFNLTNIKISGSKYLKTQEVIALTGVNQQTIFW